MAILELANLVEHENDWVTRFSLLSKNTELKPRFAHMEVEASQRAKVVSCVANHVRNLVLSRDGKTTEVLYNTVAEGKPYTSTSSFAVVAMIDISGYSSLTSSLTSLGKLGSELITNTVGEYMDQVVTCISTFGGDIIKFLGDAILICFGLKDEEETEAQLAERATYCCCLYVSTYLKSFTINLRKAIQDYQKHNILIHFQGELGISEAVMAKLTKPVRKIIYQFCATSEEKYVVVRTAESMQIICNLFGSLPSCRLLRDSLENGVTQAKDFDINATAYDFLRLFVSEALLHKLEKGNQNLERKWKRGGTRSSYISGASVGGDKPESQRNITKAEFRVVSVIFVKIGSEFSPEKAQNVFQAFVEVLRKWEGTFQQFSVDDKGQTMLACFGLPPWTHERDASYALNAAVEFEQACKNVKSFGEISISVATGDILFSQIGNEARADASLLGDAVNVAARLMGLGNSFDGYKEPLVVKCDAATYALTKEDFAHIPLGLKKVKGKLNAIEVWGVKSKDDFKNTSTIMPAIQHQQDRRTFGYNEERQVFVSALQSWLTNEGGQKIVIQGKSGQGKSKLADYVAQRVTEAGGLYCQSIRGASKSLVCEDGNAGDQHTKAIMKFLKDMGENPIMAPLMSEVLPLSIPDTPFTKRLDASTRKNLLKTMVFRIVTKSVTVDRFVFILDDVQWMDAVSLESLLEIMTKCQNILLYVFMRPLPENAPPVLTQILEIPSIQKIEITGLTQPDVNEMLVYKFEEFGVKEISPKVSRVIYEKSEKSPLVIDSICEAVKNDFFDVFYVVDKKTLEFKSSIGERKLDEYCTVDSATMMTFDRLNPQFQVVLRSASILGRYFDLADLACCLPFEATPEDIEQIIQSQDKYRYLVKQDSGGPFSYAFDTVQILTVIYDSQSFSERADSHLDAAEYFEEMLNDANREQVLPLLAYHYKKTDFQYLNKQIQYLEELANLRYTKSYYAESINSLEALMAIAETAPTDIVSKHQSAFWLATYADCRVQLTIFTQNELDLILQALTQIDRPLAKDVKNAKGELLGAFWRLYRVWKKTKGGSRPMRSGFWLTARKRVDPDASEGFFSMPRVDMTEFTAYQALYRMIAYSDIVPKDAAGLIFVKLLTFSVIHGYRDKVRFAGVLYQLSYAFMWALAPLATLLFNHGCKLENELKEEDLKTMEEWYFFKGLNLLNFGRLKEACVCFETFLKFFEERENVMWTTTCKAQLMEVYSYQADYTSLDAALVEATKIPSSSQFDIMGLLAIRRLITNDIENAKILFDQIDDAIPRSLAEDARAIVLAFDTLHIEIWMRYLNGGDFAGMLNQMMKLKALFLLVMYVGQAPNTDPRSEVKRYRWRDDELAQIRETVKIVSKAMDHAANGLDLGLFKWSSILLKSMQQLFDMKPTKALSIITSSLKGKDGNWLQENIALKANTYAVLGLFLPNTPDRVRHYSDALGIYKKHGHVLAAKWLECIEVMSQQIEYL
ncbi:hypothetical protein HDV05_005098 [Chytridiales sp. JEL 0842]|nr:hypothetical protein HDV05_005098 [Chytridiales sp. JEL 0842]